MKNAIKSANGIGLLLTLSLGGYILYYFLGASLLGIKQMDARYFGETNFIWWFGFWAPIYLTIATMLAAIALSANSGGTAGRLLALANAGSTILVLAICGIIKLKFGEMLTPAKVDHLNMLTTLSVCDTILAFGIPQLVALGMKNVNLNS